MDNTDTLLLSRSEVASCTSIHDIIEVVEQELKEDAKGTVMFPPRSGLPTKENQGAWPGYNSNLSARPAYLRLQDIAGVRWTGAFRDSKLGIPPQKDIVILTDPLNGTTLAIMEALFPLVLRVAAQAVVGVKYLGKSSINTLSIFGTGLQGRCHAIVLSQNYNIKKVKIFDKQEEAAKLFLKEMSKKLKADIVLCNNVEDTAKESDIVVTATTSKEPFLGFKDLSRGVLILNQGAGNEVHKDLILSVDKIVVGSLSQSKEVGGLKGFLQNGDITERDVYCELKDLVSGKKTGRSNESENIFLSTTGLPTLDIAIAYKIYQKALNKGLGNWMKLGVELNMSKFLSEM